MTAAEVNVWVVLAALGAAFLHAWWNFLLKSSSDKVLGMTAVIVGQAPLGLVALVLSPPLPVACWPYLAGSLALHMGYQIFLLNAYRHGDLTQVYPVARGSAPLLLTLFTLAFLPDKMGAWGLAGVLLISLGVLYLGGVGRGVQDFRALWLALLTGLCIASYSMVDGLGARVAGTAAGFFGTQAVLDGLIFAAYVRWRYPRTLRLLPTAGRRVFLIGGSSSFIAYCLVVWACTQAPIAIVSALRETSVIFALVLGGVFLREKIGGGKIIATLVVLAGAVMIRAG